MRLNLFGWVIRIDPLYRVARQEREHEIVIKNARYLFDEAARAQALHELADHEAKEFRALLHEIKSIWTLLTKGRVWTAQQAGHMASIKKRLGEL